MPFVDYKQTQLEVDGDGFIVDPSLWDEDWKVIHYLNEYYQEFEIAPMIRKLCKETGFKLRYIYELFPSGPARGACKVAGLPKPTGCV